jgi:hypothetical protein
MIGSSSPGRGWEFFSSPPRPDLFWGPPRILFNGYQSLSLEVNGRGLKLTTHLHLVPRSRMRGAIPPLPNTPPWRGAQLKHRDFTFTFTPPCCSCLKRFSEVVHVSERIVGPWNVLSLSLLSFVINKMLLYAV